MSLHILGQSGRADELTLIYPAIKDTLYFTTAYTNVAMTD